MIILAFLTAIVGLIGAIVPGLPGPPIAWAGLLFAYFSSCCEVSPALLIVMGVLAVVITVLDYLVPSWGAKRMGGTKAGVRGSNLGLLASIIVLPWLGISIGPFGIVGVLACPFFGALIGEKWKGNKDKAWRAAFGTFLGFLAGTFCKLAYAIAVIVLIIMSMF